MPNGNLSEAVITGEASQYIKDKALEKVEQIEKKVSEQSNEEKFLASPEGQRFVDDVTFLRDVYDASRLQGKSDEEIVAYIEKRYPEDVADLANQDQDVGDAWLVNKIAGIKSVWEEYPDLANSNKYVIDRVKTKDKDGNEYLEPRYVPMTEKNKMYPKTTGQFIQSIATEASLDDYPMNAFPLRQAIAKNMAMQWYPSKTNEMPMLASFIAPRSGDMWYDDEARTKMGGFGKAVAGDALEFGLNFVPWALAEKGAQTALKTGYRGAKAVGAGKVAQGLANASKGLSSTMYKFHSLGEGASDVGSVVGRGLKGAVTNTAQGLAVEGAGDVYDAFAGTDRGKGMVGFGEKGLEVDPVNLLVTAGTGAGGKALGNPSKGASARDELWGKINASPDWGADMLEQRARMGKPWNFASDIDDAWMRQYVDQNGKSTETFANEAYNTLGKDFPNARINPEVNVVQNRNARINQRNALAKEYNEGLDEINQQILDRENALKMQNAEFEPSTPDAERNLANIKEGNKKAMDDEMKEKWNNLDSQYQQANSKEMADYTARESNLPYKQNPFKERGENVNVEKVVQKSADGSTMTAIISRDGKFEIAMKQQDGSFKFAPITDVQAEAFGVKRAPAEGRTTMNDYRGVRSADNPSAEQIGREERVKVAERKLDEAKAQDKANAENYTATANEVLNSQPTDMFSSQKIPMMSPITELKLRKPNGEFTSEAKWYFGKNWKNLGYDSYEDCMSSPNGELQKWLDMENSHLTDGWDGEFGLGNGKYQPIGQLKHRINKRAPSKMQSELTESEKIANTTNASEYKLAKNNIELENGTEAQYKTLKDADAEYAMRQNQKMGKYKDPRKSNAWWQLMLRGGRGLVGNYLVPSIGRQGGASDYKFEALPNPNEENYKFKNDSYYDLYKPKIPTTKK